MDHSSGGHVSSGFITGLNTPVWTTALTPLSEGQYIGALFGLFLLSVGFRGLIAAQSYLEALLQLRYHPEQQHHLRRDQHRHLRQQQLHDRHYQGQGKLQDLVEQEPSATIATAPLHQDEKEDLVGQRTHDLHANVIPPSSTSADNNINGSPSPSDEKTSLSLAPTTALTPSTGALSPSVTPSIPGTSSRSMTTNALSPTISNSTSTPPPPPFYNAQTRKRQRKVADAKLYGFDAVSPQPQENQTTHWLNHVALPTVKPFVWQVEVSRALLTTLVVAVGYLLMLVIMTYHSGYIGTILAGVFVGDIFFGRWARARPIPPELTALQVQHEYRALQKGLKRDGSNDNNNGLVRDGQPSHPLSTLSAHSSLSSIALHEALRLAPGQHHDEMVC